MTSVELAIKNSIDLALEQEAAHQRSWPVRWQRLKCFLGFHSLKTYQNTFQAKHPTNSKWDYAGDVISIQWTQCSHCADCPTIRIYRTVEGF